MQTHYSPEFPLGFNTNRQSPHIPFYLSWDELVTITKTNIITTPDGQSYVLPAEKADKPIFTYKGNFGQRRRNDSFQGERSPYIAVDIDIAKESGIDKSHLTNEQKDLVTRDVEKILDLLSYNQRDYYFCKRSSSGCGLHIVIKLFDAEPEQISAYEKEIFRLFQSKLDKIRGELTYTYAVDYSMGALSQGLHLNHDPEVIFNPSRITSKEQYKITYEHGEDSSIVFPVRAGNDVDRIMFLRFGQFCVSKKIRLDYPDIFRLSLIYFQLWPNATAKDYITTCAPFNEERSKQRGDNIRFLAEEFKKVKSALGKIYMGRRITPSSLYHIMNLHGYQYEPRLSLQFQGYLATIEPHLFTSFREHNNILLEAPTGSGKTKTLFKYIKELAAENPRSNFVIALPYVGMVEQFRAENSDAQFDLQVYHGGIQDPFVSFTKLPFKVSQTTAPVQLLPESDAKWPLKAIGVERKVRSTGRLKMTLTKNSSNEAVPLFEEQVVFRNITLTTYDSATHLKNIHTLVIDEAHDLVKQYGFRNDAIDSLVSIRAKNKILITATPDSLLPEVEEYFHIRCEKLDAVKQTLTICSVKGAVWDAIKESIRESTSTLNFLNDKALCSQIKDELFSEGIVCSLYNADTKKQEHQIRMQQYGTITGHGLATSYLLEGFNVLNDDIARINIANEYDIDNIRQGAARARRCNPEVSLYLADTANQPSKWNFNKAFQYSKRYSELQDLTHTLNEISAAVIGDKDENRFDAFAEDMALINCRGGVYEINILALKAEIFEGYTHWLYHGNRMGWKDHLAKYFQIGDPREVTNSRASHLNDHDSFETFVKAGEMIKLFYDHNQQKRRNKKLQYSEAMRNWSKANGQIQLTESWKKWTVRYFKMKSRGEIDFEIIKSGRKFSNWEKISDMAVSVHDTPKTSKETKIHQQNKAIVNCILSLDLTKRKLSKTEIYTTVCEQSKVWGYKIQQSEKQFFMSLQDVLDIKVKQDGTTGSRFVSAITKKEKVAYVLAKEQHERDMDAKSPFLDES